MFLLGWRNLSSTLSKFISKQSTDLSTFPFSLNAGRSNQVERYTLVRQNFLSLALSRDLSINRMSHAYAGSENWNWQSYTLFAVARNFPRAWEDQCNPAIYLCQNLLSLSHAGTRTCMPIGYTCSLAETFKQHSCSLAETFKQQQKENIPQTYERELSR